MTSRIALVLVLLAALAGCGGSAGSMLPQSSSGTGSASLQRVAVTIRIPSATSAAARARHALFISANTKSAAIAVNGGQAVVANLTPGSANCVTTAGDLVCTLTISAPIGADIFTTSLYGALNATGAVLSQGKASFTIVAGQANAVPLTLNGVIASVALTLSPASPPQGSTTSIGLTVTVKDASGAAIVGGDPFLTPIVLSDTDTSGATTLSATTLKSPADVAAVTLSYNGASIASATFGATSGTVSAPTVTLTPQGSATIVFNDYSTFGYDNQRDVFNPNSTAITPANVPNIHLAWQTAIGGGDFNTQTQPVLATEIPGHAGVIFVGGGYGKVYGYDALTGKIMWTRPTGEETYTCEGNNTIYFGIGGTTAYDPNSRSFYVIGNSNASPNTVGTNTLYHLDGATGAILGQVNFAPPTPGWNSLDFSHTSVTLANGIAYVGTGGTCDISSWRGRVVAIQTPSMAILNTFYPVWNTTTQPWGGGGIWGWGGVSIDFSGNVLTGVGNTDNGTTEYGKIVAPFKAAPEEFSGLGEALVKLSPDLSKVVDSDHPIPSTIYSGGSIDLDVQGTPTVFQPSGVGCDPMTALQSKAGILFFYDETKIGHGLAAQYQLAPSTYSDGFLGGPAYSPVTNRVYAAVTSSSDSLYPPGMIAIDPGCGSPSVAWHSAFGPDSYPGGIPRSVPAVSAGGVVFVGTRCAQNGDGGCSATSASAVARRAAGVARKPLICCAPPSASGGALWALDAATGTVLNNGEPLIFTGGPIRVPPTIDGNWIFVLDNNGNMYGLTIDPKYTATNSVARQPDARTLKVWEVAPHPKT